MSESIKPEDPDDDEERQILQNIRDLDLSPAARERVIRAVQRSRHPNTPKARRFQFILITAVILIAVVGLTLLGKQKSAESKIKKGPVRVLEAEGVQNAFGPLAPGHRVSEGKVTVANGGNLRLGFPSAHVSMKGPAEFELREEGIAFYRGGALIEGDLVVEGGGCEAIVGGAAQVRKFATHMDVEVTHGDAKTNGDACRLKKK